MAAMSAIEAPGSCRKCSFFKKCFDDGAIDAADRPQVVPSEWISYPLAIGGAMTRVIACGDNGPPIVLVHGPGWMAEQWTYNLNALARAGYRVFALDLPGHGFSSKTRTFAYSTQGYSAFLADFLSELREPAILIGASVGGHASAHCTADNPELVRTLVLVAATGAVPLGADLRQKLQRMTVYRSREGGMERLRRTFFDPRLATDELAEQCFRANTSPGAAESLSRLGAYLANDIDEDVLGQKLQVVAESKPILFVWGANDTVLPAEFGRRSQASAGGRSELAAIADAGHAPHYEQPSAFNRTLLSFLSAQHGRLQTPAPSRVAALIS